MLERPAAVAPPFRHPIGGSDSISISRQAGQRAVQRLRLPGAMGVDQLDIRLDDRQEHLHEVGLAKDDVRHPAHSPEQGDRLVGRQAMQGLHRLP